MTKPWGFYGRREELHTLDRFMNHRVGFSSLAIYGRRNVGKTALFQYFETTNKHRGDSRQIIKCTLNSPKGSCHRFVKDVQSAIMMTDKSLLDDYVADEDEDYNVAKLVRHLLEKGHIVMIDEFQRIRLDGDPILESLFQKLIDDLRIPGTVRPDIWNPRLIVMGSEQQRLVEMFKNVSAPMFNRITDYLHIIPWTFSEFKEMALDQGWASHQNRLLTLWTAYNGLPRHWDYFHKDGDLSDFSNIPDDGAWTRQFMKREEHRRTSPGEGFQDQMEVQLRPSDCAIVRWLGEKPEGRNLATDLKAPAER
ncbi:MAG: ATP-binding protein, partial [Aestuariivita sp.]|nr:ATP-binding protein [Aestuariivita sp.]